MGKETLLVIGVVCEWNYTWRRWYCSSQKALWLFSTEQRMSSSSPKRSPELDEFSDGSRRSSQKPKTVSERLTNTSPELGTETGNMRNSVSMAAHIAPVCEREWETGTSIYTK